MMLKQRVITAVISLVVVIAAVVLGPVYWRALIFLGCLACAYEFASILGQGWFRLSAIWAYCIIGAVIWWSHWVQPLVFQAMIFITFLIPVLTRNRTTMVQATALFAGALYIGIGGMNLAGLRDLDNGLAWVLLCMVSIWATDTAAFFAGSWLKGPKLWPQISPNKTISGALAGILGGGIGASLIGLASIHTAHVAWYFLVGCLISVAGQLGDLVESAYKRSAGVKDSGKLLPGHGGVLDRVDSLLFASPLAMFLVSQHPWI